MKKLDLKRTMAQAVASSAAMVANTASSKCILFMFNEPKMPKSLYKK